jgi:hypothetical protein
MKRCVAAFFIFAAAVSLLMCAATVVMWVRSYWVADTLHLVRYGIDVPGDHGDVSDWYSAISARGAIRLELSEEDDGNGASTPRSARLIYDSDAARFAAGDVEHGAFGSKQWKRFGFATGSEHYLGAHAGSDLSYVVMPYWPFVLVAAIGSVPIVVRVKRRRPERGRCIRCSYDLTGNVSGTCPECGASVAGKVGT